MIFQSNFDPAIPAEHPPDSGKNARKKVAKKQQQKKWKEIRKTATLPMQKKRRLMHAVHNLQDEDRLWLLRECQTQKSKEMLTRTHSEEDGGPWPP